jgi:hypothetical protein
MRKSTEALLETSSLGRLCSIATENRKNSDYRSYNITSDKYPTSTFLNLKIKKYVFKCAVRGGGFILD